MSYNLANLSFKNAVPLSMFLNYASPISAADTAAGSTGFVYIDHDVTLGANTTLSAKWIGTGGVITLGAYSLTGDFWAPPNIQMFNVNSTGRALSVSTGGGEINAAWFGAADGTESATAINAALRYAKLNASGAKNRKVILNSGSYLISAQIVLFDGTSLEGAGTESTILLASNTFSELTTSGLLRIGNDTVQVYGTTASNLTVDLNNLANAIGCYTTDAQDGTGFEHIVVKNVLGGKGVWINGTGGSIGFCNNYILNDIYVGKNSGSNGGTAYHVDGGTLPGQMENLTLVASGAGKFTYGYYFKDSTISASSLSIDGSSSLTGVNISTGVLYVEIRGLTILSSNATGINIESQNSPVLVTSYFYIGGGNMLVDAGGGTAAAKTISGNGITPLYARGQSTWLNSLVNLPGLGSSDPGVAGQLWGNANVVTRSP